MQIADKRMDSYPQRTKSYHKRLDGAGRVEGLKDRCMNQRRRERKQKMKIRKGTRQIVDVNVSMIMLYICACIPSPCNDRSLVKT